MSEESHSASRNGRPRGVRLALLSSGLVFMAVLGAWSVMGIIALFQQGHALRAALLSVVALLLLLLSVRVIALNWRAVDPIAERPSVPPDGNDQTGNWGVGGPSMREPGSTGVWPARHVDRRYQEQDD
jgi:uncharacterized membrane protein YcjF (UPF0283 family)